MIVGGALEDAEAVWVLLARAMCMLPSLFALVWRRYLGAFRRAIRDHHAVSMYDAMYFPCRLSAFDVTIKSRVIRTHVASGSNGDRARSSSRRPRARSLKKKLIHDDTISTTAEERDDRLTSHPSTSSSSSSFPSSSCRCPSSSPVSPAARRQTSGSSRQVSVIHITQDTRSTAYTRV